MSDVHKMYTITLNECRATAKKKVVENERCYESLSDKDSEYATAVYALGVLHRRVLAIYEEEPQTKAWMVFKTFKASIT